MQLIFFVERLDVIRKGHLYDVCKKITCSLYKVKDQRIEFVGGMDYVNFDDLNNWLEKKEIVPYFQSKEFELNVEKIDTLKFKGLSSLSDYEIFCFIKDEITNVIGKEVWEHY